MTVYELNRDQLIELKQQYMMQEMDEHGETPSYEDLAEADDVYSDEYIQSMYAHVDFVPDDFACRSGLSSEYSLELGECLGDRGMIAAELRQIADLIENGYYSGMANYGTNWSIM